ncbi:uncharacterized protein LOC129579554 [Sitodiplosis mosellana]|uniref:uncharacterized protein LOC129579554 n=1 Tax=Sitodiplosis mosellana TaxID=263140 RepID=UPI002443B8FF|nr:uncharacterized protein LOC129579554 [Sitodiplosis mosellana]
MKLFLVFCVAMVSSVVGLLTHTEHVSNLQEFGINAILSNRGIEDRFNCLKDGSQTIFNDNSDLHWWFDEASKTALKLIEAFEKCESLSGIAHARCTLKLQATAVQEIRQLLKKLPDDKKEFPSEVKDFVKNCLADSIIV